MAEIPEITARLLDYVSYGTQSGDDRESIPSMEKQFEPTHRLAGELEELGASQMGMSEQGYVYACTLSDLEEGKTSLALGFIAHVDTAPSLSGKDVEPRFIRDYDGQGICPSREQDIWTGTADSPDLGEYGDKTLITTDGTTPLGAGNRVGIAKIAAMIAYFLRHPEVKHGTICIGFTPDEEVGRGIDGFGVEGPGVDVTYAVDGGVLEKLEYESSNAVSGRVTVRSASIRPGAVKGCMRNVLLMAMEFQSLPPADENSMYTEGYEGFYHLDRMTGCVEETRTGYIIRDHDRVKLEHRKELFAQAVESLNRKYGSGTVEAVVKNSYYNMREKIEPHMDLIDKAKASMKKLGIRLVVVPIRGGTDGARLSYMGLSYPNLCTGGRNFHGRHELIPVQSMGRITELLIGIARFFAGTITDNAASPCPPDASAL